MHIQLGISVKFTMSTQNMQNLPDFFKRTQGEQDARRKSSPSRDLAAVRVLLFEQDGRLRVLLTKLGKDLKLEGPRRPEPPDVIKAVFFEALTMILLQQSMQKVQGGFRQSTDLLIKDQACKGLDTLAVRRGTAGNSEDSNIHDVL
ncbi:hypothetical protein CPC08DRAFT_779576 [Agrocybe pediades]|nr:hypothetical protein CPC08DRAFT_779576 [Agrocybe pediades]